MQNEYVKNVREWRTKVCPNYRLKKTLVQELENEGRPGQGIIREI